MTGEAFEVKMRLCMDGKVSEPVQDRILGLCGSLDTVGNIGELTQLLR